MNAVLLGEYEVLHGLGQGSQAQVFMGRHLASGQSVALKTFPSRSPGFMRELVHLHSLNHPHIIRCQGLVYGLGERYLVLEYADGGSLRAHLEKHGALPLPEVRRLALHLGSALAHAHSHHLLHRDLKSDNVLLCASPDGVLYKLSDLGIASAPEFQAEVGISGTPAYMAPEQFYDEASAASDLYALGVVLFEAATGDLPFEALGPAALYRAHQHQAPPLHRISDPDLRHLLARLLDKRPEGRGTARDLLSAPLPAAARPVGLRPAARRESLAQEHELQVRSGERLVGPAPGWEGCVLVADAQGTDLVDLQRGRRGQTRYCALPLQLVSREQTPSGARVAVHRSRVGWLEPRSGVFRPLFRHRQPITGLALDPAAGRILYADARQLLTCDLQGHPLEARPCPNYFWPAQLLTLPGGTWAASSGPVRPQLLLGPEPATVALSAPVLALATTAQGNWLAVTMETADQPPLLVTARRTRTLRRGIFAAAAGPGGLAALTQEALYVLDAEGHERARLELAQPPSQLLWLDAERIAVLSCAGSSARVTGYRLQGDA